MGMTIQQPKLDRPDKLQLSKGAVDASEPSFQVFLSVLRKALPAELKAHGAALPKKDVEAMAEALARQVTRLAVALPTPPKGRKASGASKGEWISTQEAANRCGFSRPFVAALLDSGAYNGQVNRTPGGHRKVLAGEFEALMAQAATDAPRTLAQARQSVDLTRLDQESETPRPARKQSRARAQTIQRVER